MAAAARDVGNQERSWRNDHPLFDYYRRLGGSQNPKSSKGWRDPYCGFAVYAWHRQAGLLPPIRSPGQALAWSKRPGAIKLGPFARPADIARLDSGMVINFRFGRQNHTGIIETPYPLYGITIEGNTSLAGAIGVYKTKQEGVIRKKRFWKAAWLATDWRNSPVADPADAIKLRKQFVPP